jgi:hypothetical protein
VGVEVKVGEGVGVFVASEVGVWVGVLVMVLVVVLVGVLVGVAVFVAVGVGVTEASQLVYSNEPMYVPHRPLVVPVSLLYSPKYQNVSPLGSMVISV